MTIRTPAVAKSGAGAAKKEMLDYDLGQLEVPLTRLLEQLLAFVFFSLFALILLRF